MAFRCAISRCFCWMRIFRWNTLIRSRHKVKICIFLEMFSCYICIQKAYQLTCQRHRPFIFHGTSIMRFIIRRIPHLLRFRPLSCLRSFLLALPLSLLLMLCLHILNLQYLITRKYRCTHILLLINLLLVLRRSQTSRWNMVRWWQGWLQDFGR